MGGPELTGAAEVLVVASGVGEVDGDVAGVGPHALMAMTASTQRLRLANDEDMGEPPPQSENESQRILVEIQCQIRSKGLSSKLMSTASIDTRLAARGRRR